MARSREGRDKEFWLGEIRKLKSENRNLRKRLKQLERKEHIFDDYVDEDDVPELPTGNENKKLPRLCHECGKGLLVEKNLIGRIYDECNTCGYRSAVKRHEKTEE